MIKPQFEAERLLVGKGGVVRDPAVHRQVLQKVAGYARQEGLSIHGLLRSPISGPAGNTEFLMHLRRANASHDFDLPAAIDRCLAD